MQKNGCMHGVSSINREEPTIVKGDVPQWLIAFGFGANAFFMTW